MNPMAVEQASAHPPLRAADTAQVYNLVAEDTVEQRIYGCLRETQENRPDHRKLDQ